MGAPLDRKRLIAILGMLGSKFDGEHASAGLKAVEVLQASGFVWEDVIQLPQTPQHALGTPYSAQGSQGSQGGVYGADMAVCLRHRFHLTDWETEFVMDLRSSQWSPTNRQITKMAQIAESLRKRKLF